MRRKLTFMFILALATTTVKAQNHETISAVDQIFADVDKTNSPGCALAVIKEGEIVYSRGYGMADLEHNIAIAPSSVFYIGSVSKQFVTMCMLLLEEEGKISLDDNIRKYFPELPDYGHPITIRNLIHHTSGIRDYLTLWSLAGNSYLDNMENEVVYDLICRQKELNFEPGTKYLYSNSCYFMMALLVEKVTGQSIRAFAKEKIFGPLKMNSTTFYDDNRKLIPNRSFGYGKNPSGGFDNMLMRFDLVGSGGIYSTIEDLFLWDQNFYHNVLGNGGQTIIEKMLTNGKYKDGSEVDYAFALVNDHYRGLRTVSHGGALGGYRSHYLQFPDQAFSVIILGNLAELGPGQRCYQVADIFLKDSLTDVEEETAGTTEQTAKNAEFFAPPNALLSKITGRYYSFEIDASYTFSLNSENQLVLEIKNGQKQIVMAKSPTNFRSRNINMRFNEQYDAFELDAGRVTNLKFVRQ